MGAVEEQPEQSVCVHFINTVSVHDGSSTNDRLSDFEGYIGWAGTAGLLQKSEVQKWVAWGKAHRSEATRILSKAVNFREYMYGLFSKGAESQHIAPAALAELNKMLATPALKRTFQVRGGEIAETWDCGEGPMAPLRRIGLSAADLLHSGAWRDVIECDRETCAWLAVDTSRNHSRRYCSSTGCGNIVRVQRHYRLHKSGR